MEPGPLSVVDTVLDIIAIAQMLIFLGHDQYLHSVVGSRTVRSMPEPTLQNVFATSLGKEIMLHHPVIENRVPQIRSSTQITRSLGIIARTIFDCEDLEPNLAEVVPEPTAIEQRLPGNGEFHRIERVVVIGPEKSFRMGLIINDHAVP